MQVAIAMVLPARRQIETPKPASDASHVYWRYCLNIDDSKIDGGGVAMAGILKEKNIFTAPRYIQKPAFPLDKTVAMINFDEDPPF